MRKRDPLLPTDDSAHLPKGLRVLILEARYYAAIADDLAAGAIAELEARGVAWDRIPVPGALELPLALNQAVEAELLGPWDETGLLDPAEQARWCGAIALGCVIRGETSHYDIVCEHTYSGLMTVALEFAIPLGNGVLTVDTEAQALARAAGGRANKGGDAARACLTLVAMTHAFEDMRP